jgi:Flp pilus assembly protein TadG
VIDERGRGDRGSAVAEFVMVAAMLLALFLAVVQLGLALHVRNTLVAAAAEGARLGASADRGPEDAAARTRELITEALSERFAGAVSAVEVDGPAGPVIEVEVRASLPVVGFAGPARTLTVQGHALEESQ